MRQNRLGTLLYHFFYSISTSVVSAIIVSWPLLLFFVLVQKTNETVNLTVRQVMHNYTQLLCYLVWPFKFKLQMSNFHSSSSALFHFYECKLLFVLAIAVFIICSFIWLRLKRKRRLRVLRLNKTAALIFILLPIAVLPFALTNFNSFFAVFHQILFHNTDWLFNPETDPIINVLTEGFFAACFAVAGIVYELYFAKKLMNK